MALYFIGDCVRLFMWAVLTSMVVQSSIAWTYHSTTEAFVVKSNKRCIGNCEPYRDTHQCVYKFDRSLAPCVPTNVTTLRYRTLHNEKCISNCDKFDDLDYEWCVASDYERYQCSRRIATKAYQTTETENKFTTCLDECATRGSKYHWCNAANGKQERCKPHAITHTFDYPTIDGSVCASRCKLDHNKHPYCYTVQGKWKKCFLNPSYNIVNTFTDHSHRSRRAADDETANELFFQCNGVASTIVARHRTRFPISQVRADPGIVITPDINPVLWYIVLPTYSYFFYATPEIDLPLVVKALITNHTLKPVGANRDAFTTAVDNNYNGMDRGTQHNNYDERGHLLASRLGGPMEKYNIFPQTWQMNRGPNSDWYKMETEIDNFLRGHSNRCVQFTAVLSYATDDHHMVIHRPKGVLVQLRAYIGKDMVDLYNLQKIGLGSSRTENMYFSNDPNHSCSPLPAPTARPRRRG